MITHQQMRDIVVSRKLQIIPLEDSATGIITWVCRTIDGSRAAPSNGSYPSPELAVEAADLHFTAAEERERLRKADILLSTLDKGEYYIKPRQVTSTSPSGEPVISTVFDVLTLDGKPTPIKDKLTYSDAVVEFEEEKRKGRVKV